MSFHEEAMKEITRNRIEDRFRAAQESSKTKGRKTSSITAKSGSTSHMNRGYLPSKTAIVTGNRWLHGFLDLLMSLLNYLFGLTAPAKSGEPRR